MSMSSNAGLQDICATDGRYN